MYKDISAEADTLEIRETKAIMVIIELLFDENCVKQLMQYRILLLLFTNGNQKSQKYLLGAIEKLIELKKEVLLPKVSLILKSLYDTDVVDEEVLLEWGKKASKKYVSKEISMEIQEKAAPFLKWLQEAEEEDDSEDEDEDEEDDLEVGGGSRNSVYDGVTLTTSHRHEPGLIYGLGLFVLSILNIRHLHEINFSRNFFLLYVCVIYAFVIVSYHAIYPFFFNYCVFFH